MSVNKSLILGNIVADPELKESPHGKLATFSVATNESYTNKDGVKVNKAEYHNIVVYGKLVEAVVENYVKKGNELYLEGKIRTKKWEDKAGNKRSSTYIVVRDFDDKIRLIGGKKDSTIKTEKPESNPEPEDDLPF